MSFLSYNFIIFCLPVIVSNSFLVNKYIAKSKITMASIGGNNWDNNNNKDLINFKVPSYNMPKKNFNPIFKSVSENDLIIFEHLGEYNNNDDFGNDFDTDKKNSFNLNVGRALEVLRRELPMCFFVTNLDFSIFANQITVCNGNSQSKMVMQKSLYSAAVKSLRVASSISFTSPSMNVKKIEYIESCRTIQCLVDVVLPDTIRIEGQAMWEGMFYFGLDTEGLIETHIFDRKISNLRPNPLIDVKAYPWLRASPAWTSDLISGNLIPQPSFASDVNNVNNNNNNNNELQ